MPVLLDGIMRYPSTVFSAPPARDPNGDGAAPTLKRSSSYPVHAAPAAGTTTASARTIAASVATAPSDTCRRAPPSTNSSLLADMRPSSDSEPRAADAARPLRQNESVRSSESNRAHGRPTQASASAAGGGHASHGHLPS